MYVHLEVLTGILFSLCGTGPRSGRNGLVPSFAPLLYPVLPPFSGIFCTQEEAEGFRNMTYFYDRPDNMATYTTLITAEKQKYPYLLSNGNPVDSGDLEDGLHFVKWEVCTRGGKN